MSNTVTLPVYELRAFEKLSHIKDKNDYLDTTMSNCLFVRVKGLHFEVFYVSKYFLAHHFFLACEETAESRHYVLDMRKLKAYMKGHAPSSLVELDLDLLENTSVNQNYLSGLDLDSFTVAKNAALYGACDSQLFNATYLAGVTTFLDGCKPDKPVEWFYPKDRLTPLCAHIPGYDFKLDKDKVCYGELTAVLMPCRY